MEEIRIKQENFKEEDFEEELPEPPDFIFDSNSSFSNGENEISSDQKAKKPRRTFTLDFKLKIVEEAKKTNNRKVGRIYNIDESTIRGWVKQEDRLRQSRVVIGSKKFQEGKQLTRLPGSGSRAHFVELEKQVFEWLMHEKMVKRQNVTRTQIKAKAKELSGEDSGFCASNGWCQNFLVRHGMTERQQKSSDENCVYLVQQETEQSELPLEQNLKEEPDNLEENESQIQDQDDNIPEEALEFFIRNIDEASEFISKVDPNFKRCSEVVSKLQSAIAAYKDLYQDKINDKYYSDNQ